MNEPNQPDITKSREYRKLIKVRHQIIWPLMILVISAYMSFILLIAFAPSVLAQKIGDGVISVGIASGLGMIFFIFLMSYVYVRLANKHIEPLISKLHSMGGHK